MASSKSSRQTKDFISNVPDIVTDKILEHLPIRMAARTSVLSKHWRRNWLSLKRLIFDYEFCKEHVNNNGSCNWQKCSNIISSILFHHNGPVHDFTLHIPRVVDECMNLSQWLYFLSKNAVRMIAICNWTDNVHISSYIFRCSELVELELDFLSVSAPPTSFSGFPKLQYLVLLNNDFTHEDLLGILLANCRMLVTLRIENCCVDHIIIDVPSLENLTVTGRYDSLDFKDVRNLKRISLSLMDMPGKAMAIEAFDVVNLLACSCQLQCIQFGGDLCKLFAAENFPRKLSPGLYHLKKIVLNSINLSRAKEVHCLLYSIRSSPNLEELHICAFREIDDDGEPLFLSETQVYEDCTLQHLCSVIIIELMGTKPELKLIQFLLHCSPALEIMYVQLVAELDKDAKLEALAELTQYCRASPKARLYFKRD